ncbi:hypothetical protein GCM10027162_55030 [Streptomyces incanus]
MCGELLVQGSGGGRPGVVVADAVKLVRDKEPHGLADDMLRVEELEAALPSMTRWRVPGGRGVDWAALECDLSVSGQ